MSKGFCKEHEKYFEIQDLKAQLQDKGIVISELKKLIEKLKGKSVDTKFEKSSVIRQSNAFKSQRPSVLGKPTTFSNSFERRDFSTSTPVTQNNMSNDFSKPVTAQTLPPNNKSILKNTNVLALGIPQLKSNPVGDSVLHNNSQGKKHDVKDHHRSVKFYMNKTSVTACNDSLNAKTLNVNFVCATRDKCVLNEKHDVCVLNSVAKPLKKTVALESNQKPRNITRKLYERIKIVLFIVDSGCSKHMTGNLKLLINFVEKFLGTVKFGNDQIAPILGYGDLVQGAVTIKRVYYVEGLNHNLFSVGQFCDEDLEVAFRKSTSFIRDLKGNNLLTGSRDTDLYSITLQDTNSPNPICLMAKATSYTWTHFLRSKDETPEVLINFLRLVQRGLQAQKGFITKCPLLEHLNKTALSKDGTNHSLVIPRHEKSPYHIINNRKPSVKFFYIFGSLCYIVRDGENLDKMKEKGDECIFVGYYTQSRAYRVFNKRIRVIMESIHVNFDELPLMASDHISSNPAPECQTMVLEHDSLSPVIQRQQNVPQADRTVTTSNEMDLLFSLMFDELLNGSSNIVSKSSVVSSADAPIQRQQHTTPLNNHTTPAPTCQVLTLAPTVSSSENINQA
nr:integrase, catalytic region, zinc finger, CCHC-type, peptidase aspartic, catalytic [Tanacetum cinerariifolium]